MCYHLLFHKSPGSRTDQISLRVEHLKFQATADRREGFPVLNCGVNMSHKCDSSTTTYRWLSMHRNAKPGFNSKTGLSTKYGSLSPFHVCIQGSKCTVATPIQSEVRDATEQSQGSNHIATAQIVSPFPPGSSYRVPAEQVF